MNQFKLTKDQIQKIGLSAMGFVVLLYVYFNFFLGPLNKSRATMQKTMKGLHDKIGASKNELAKATNLERQAGAATARFAALKGLSPEGAPIAWFPPRMKAFFANEQIDKVTARLESNAPFKQADLAAWMKYTWLLDVPQADFATLGKTIADLENTQPLLAITRITLRVLADDPQFQQVNLTATTAIVKR